MYDSFHPPNTKNAIPYSQLLRLRRLTSDDNKLKERRNELIGFFSARKYPDHILQNAERRSSNVQQADALVAKAPSSNHRLPFVTEYHPSVYKVQNILKKHWNILQEDNTSLFQEPPLLSLRRGRNIKDILVHTKLSPSEELGGTFPCNRPRCLTCPHTCRETTIVGVDGMWRITESSSCTTKNVVYCITCTLCGKLYVGETKRMLAERIREHLRDIKKNSRTSPVAQHFNTRGHSIEDFSVNVLRKCTNDHDRKAWEMRLISKLGTLDPKGINIDLNYNV